MNPIMRMRDALRPINRAPAGSLRDAWIHHGFRVALLLLIACAVPWLFPRASLPEFDGIEPGAVAEHTVNAEFAFDVPKDPADLAVEQQEAEASVSTILAADPSRADSAIASTRHFFARLDSAVAAAQRRAVDDELEAEERENLIRGSVNDVVNEAGITFMTDDQLDYLASAGQREQLLGELVRVFDGSLREDVIRVRDLQNVAGSTVFIRSGGRDQVRQLESITRMDQFYRSATEDVTDRLPSEGTRLFSQLLIQQAQPTLSLDTDAMLQARQQARAAVPRSAGFVMAAERIITANEVVGELEHRRLKAYEAERITRGMAGTGNGFFHGLGMVLLVASVLGILVFAAYTFRRDIYEDLRSFAVLLGLILIVLTAAGVVASTGSSPALIPIAFAGLLAAALFDSLIALVLVSIIAGILLGQPEFSGLPAPMIAVAGGVTAAFAVRSVHSRSQSWILIALITGGYGVAALCLALTGHYSWTEFATTALFGLANATLCTALAMGAVLPLLEVFTGRTTEQSLLELADMNRPLLRRLSREAPGTHAHTMNLANLVEAACDAIGADSVLGRVGVYYHDIGKLERPQYFIENQPKGLNPHDRLRPSQSAEILRDHVRAGLRMADEARLPEVVKQFIREHHGTQKIQYFLEKALHEEGVTDIDPNDFAYPGPKPQSKETAVTMLGDAVEAASRTLASPSPERIRALIDDLVTDRVQQGELDECGLTFRDLGRVRQQFAHVLTGLYHHRIDYPRPRVRDAVPHVAMPDPPAGGKRASGDPGQAQFSIDLDQASQGDTGPPPTRDPAPESVSLPEGAGSSRPD